MEYELRDKLINTAICGSPDHAAAASELLGAAAYLMAGMMPMERVAEVIAGAAIEAGLAAAAAAPAAQH